MSDDRPSNPHLSVSHAPQSNPNLGCNRTKRHWELQKYLQVHVQFYCLLWCFERGKAWNRLSWNWNQYRYEGQLILSNNEALFVVYCFYFRKKWTSVPVITAVTCVVRDVSHGLFDMTSLQNPKNYRQKDFQVFKVSIFTITFTNKSDSY